jgi:hypothetical protein
VNITEQKLRARVSAGEGPNLELQPRLQNDSDIAEALCAFANTRGGWLVVGAAPSGPWPGLQKAKQDMSRIRLVAEEDIKPALPIAMNSVACSNSEHGMVVVVQVDRSDDRPHSVPGAGKSKRDIIVRIDTGNHVAQGATLNAMRSHRHHGQPKDALEAKILSWMLKRSRKAPTAAGDASPEDFSKAGKVGLRRASKAFINMEMEGLLVGRGDRGKRMYALP